MKSPATHPLHPSFLGQYVIYQATCASTNTLAAQYLFEKKLPDGTIVITDHQYQGRGQRGRCWHSEPYKNLTFSVVLYPTFLMASQSFFLNIVTTLALHQVLSAYIPQKLTIKWPNDIYHQDKKLSGVLIENTVTKQYLRSSVIGIGLNVNQTHFEIEGPTSLTNICGRHFDLRLVLDELLGALKDHYHRLQTQGEAPLRADYLKRMHWINEERTFQDANERFQGRIKDIDTTGKLVIAQSSGLVKHYAFQEVSFLA